MSVSARNITLRIGDAVLLNDVSMHAPAGSITALVGPNGAGKSTLLSVLSGDAAPTAGTVECAGVDPHTTSALELARTRSVMLQDVSVAFSFLVRDVVEMGRSPWPASAEDAEIVDAALDANDLHHLASREVDTLSGGERARVAFARVMAQKTPVVLLDEPTAAMDVRYQEITMGLARTLASEGATVIAVLHDLELASRYCENFVCLKRGEVAAAGDVSEVYTAEVLSHVYEWPITIEHTAHGIHVGRKRA